MNDTLRAFIAVDLTKEIQGRIAEIEAALERFSSQVRWVRPESIHLTLKFLGEITQDQFREIQKTFASRSSGIAPFLISVEGLGFFPNVRGPRVVWIGIEKGKEPLEALARFVEQALRTAGFPPESRPYSPHATIGRIKFLRDVKAFLEAADPLEKILCGQAPVREFHLYESELNRSGSIYTKRATFELE